MNVFFRSGHTASLLVSGFNHTRTARLSGSEGRAPAHRPPSFACIDGHALARQNTHLLLQSETQLWNRAYTKKSRLMWSFLFKLQGWNSVSTKVLDLSRGSALQRSGYFGLHTYTVYSCIRMSEPARECVCKPLRQTHFDTITAVTTNFLA